MLAMLALDTNVLVRFLVRDDAAQFARASQLIASEVQAGRKLYLCQLVLLETSWVLRSRYQMGKANIIVAIQALLESSDVQFEDESCVEEALFNWKNQNADFADCLIIAHNRHSGCRATASFDSKANKLPGCIAV